MRSPATSFRKRNKQMRHLELSVVSLFCSTESPGISNLCLSH
jgi:hypothetical protein